MMKIYQKLIKGQYETVYLDDKGKMTCDCSNINCVHIKGLRKAIASKSMLGWQDVSPKQK